LRPGGYDVKGYDAPTLELLPDALTDAHSCPTTLARLRVEPGE
jgi:hypothetical protein